MPQGKRVPTIVYNHTGQFDWGWFLLSKFQAPTVMEIHWIAEKFFRNTIDANQCIVIKDFERKIEGRGDVCAQRIQERQALIMDSEEDWNPLVIAPEGLRTNGKYIVRFKRGAFLSLRPVLPATIRYDYTQCGPTTDPTGYNVSMLVFSQFIPTTVHINTYAPFIPNEYLFTEYRKKLPGGDKMEDWQVYAEAVRDMIAKEANLIKSPLTGADNINYKYFMRGVKDEVTSSTGKTFRWPHTPGPCCVKKVDSNKKTD